MTNSYCRIVGCVRMAYVAVPTGLGTAFPLCLIHAGAPDVLAVLDGIRVAVEFHALLVAALSAALSGPWSGPAGELLRVLDAAHPEATGEPGGELWPRSPRALAAILTRQAPALRRVGWGVEKRKNSHTKRFEWDLVPPGCRP